MTIAIVILRFVPENNAGQILFIGYAGEIAEADIKAAVAPFGSIVSVKSRNVTSSGTNMVCDVKVKDAEGLIKALNGVKGVNSVSLIAHDGEFRG